MGKALIEVTLGDTISVMPGLVPGIHVVRRELH